MQKNIPTDDPNRQLHDLSSHITRYLEHESKSSASSDENLYATVTHWLENHSLDSDLYSPITKAKLEFALKDAEETLGIKAAEVKQQIPFLPQANPKFSFVDLFAGIGGFRLALQELGGKCVFSSEWDKSAQQTYFRNFGIVPFGDINHFTEMDSTSHSVRSDEDIDRLIPDHDVLTAGFPCQPFSRAGVSARSSLGKAHGFECQTQGTLFYSVARVANVKQPKFLFLENVRNIVSHDEGRTFETIRNSIEEIGYKFHSELIDSSSVVAQRRLRCYMICVREDLWDEQGRFEFPSFDGDPIPLSSVLDKKPDPAYTISDKLWSGHQNRTARNLERGAGFTAFTSDLSKPSNTIVSRYYKDGKECLVPQPGKNPRLLTIGECVRLFGYDQSAAGTFLPALSRTASYRQFGNSVVVPVVQRIADKAIDQYILKSFSVAHVEALLDVAVKSASA